MNSYLYLIASLMLIKLLIGLLRIIKGPTPADKIIALQLFGTTGVSILIILSIIEHHQALMNTALVIAILAPLTLITFVKISGK